jgi:5-methylcytosine-specific restriction protein B
LTDSNEEYELAGPDADGKGVYLPDGFLVKAGSIARRELAPSGKNVSTVHQRLVEEGVLEEHEGRFRFTRDHKFATPSGAAAAVLGRTANGWISWKRSDGVTLSEVKRVSRKEQTPILSDKQREQILARHAQLTNEGKLPSRQQLDESYAAFREKFGPAALAKLDGEALLNFMHEHGNQSSLVYWLEFKNDEGFRTRNFGSIAGGSALKFRIFRRKETNQWQAAGPKGYLSKDITVDEAIEFARSHRDQFIAGAGLLEALSEDADDEAYAQLQDQMDVAQNAML